MKYEHQTIYQQNLDDHYTGNSNNNTTITPNNNYNNNYNNNTEPGVFIISPEDGARICKAYTDNIGPLNASVANMIEFSLKKGLSVDDVLLAIEETAFAPRPSAAYLRAILRNWLRDGRIIARARHAANSDQPQEWWKAKPVNNYDDIQSEWSF